jgi:hypothetical protein
MATDLQQLAALAALNKMMAGGYFDICTIDKIAKMFGVMPEQEAYTSLRALHCVHFDKMPRELYASIPALIQQALNGCQVFQFDLRASPEIPMITGIVEQKKAPLLRRLFAHD